MGFVLSLSLNHPLTPCHGVTGQSAHRLGQGRACTIGDPQPAKVRMTHEAAALNLTYTALGAKEYPKEQMEVFVDGQVLIMNNYQSIEVMGSSRQGLKTKVMDTGLAEELRLFGLAIKGDQPWPNPLWQQIQAMEMAFSSEQKGQS